MNKNFTNGSKSTPHKANSPKMPKLIDNTEKTADITLNKCGMKIKQIIAVQTNLNFFI
jgi:hypothetical protein